MHGEKIHEDRGIDRRYSSQKSRRRDKVSTCGFVVSAVDLGQNREPKRNGGANEALSSYAASSNWEL